MLEQIKIASPCSADWDRMEGSDRVRFCAHCQKNVFNLSAMTRRDAEALLKQTNGDLCAKLYRRADGTVLTEDCPVGLQMKITRVRRRAAWAIASALSVATAFAQDPAILSGKVTDAAGAGLRATTIKLTEPKSGTSAETTTDASGRFKLVQLEPGNYRLTTMKEGFQSHDETVSVSSAKEAILDIRLDVGTVGEVVSNLDQMKVPLRRELDPPKQKK